VDLPADSGKSQSTESKTEEAMKQTEEKTRTRLKAIALAAVVVLTIVLATPGAHASCGQIAGMKAGRITLPSLASAEPQAEGEGLPGGVSYDSIVGLWLTTYTAGNSPFGETLKQWHSAGTEFENVAHNPEIGNICFGVWKQVGVRKVRLHHVGWLFSDDGTLTGSFTIDETDTLASNGMTYKGTFEFKTYDTNGKFTGTEVTGRIVASRITVS
jgi:hypothetical protein